MDLIITAFWFFLPAGLANMSPVFANRIPGLNNWKTPMDFGKSLAGKRIFGNNKTWRGIVFGTFIGALTGWLVGSFVYPEIAWPLYLVQPNAVLGAVMGFGALFGDAVESFFKRHRGIASGDSWFPFDQTDYIIGGLALSYPATQAPASFMLIVLGIYFGLHLTTSYIGYTVGLKAKPI